MEIKLNEQVKLTQAYKSEYIRKANEISNKLKLLLGYTVSFDDENIKLSDANNSKNFLIFQVRSSSPQSAGILFELKKNYLFLFCLLKLTILYILKIDQEEWQPESL